LGSACGERISIVFHVARAREIGRGADEVWRCLATFGEFPELHPGWTSRVEPLDDGSIRHEEYVETAFLRKYCFELVDGDTGRTVFRQSITVRPVGRSTSIELSAEAANTELAASFEDLYDQALLGLDNL
jgi:hypothetical protein